MDHGKLLDMGTVDELVVRHGGKSSVECEIQSGTDGIALPGIVEDGVLRFAAERPIEEISRLASEGVKFATLKLTQPGLEGVFLELTGRSLRDG
jgi:hypothetical protein